MFKVKKGVESSSNSPQFHFPLLPECRGAYNVNDYRCRQRFSSPANRRSSPLLTHIYLFMFSGSLSIPTLVQVSSPLKYLASSLKPFTCAVVRLSWTSIIRLRSAHLLASSSTVAPHLLFSLIYGFSLRRNNQIHNKEPFCRRVLTSLHWLETQCRHISCCSPTVRNRDSTHLHGLYVSIPELLDSPPQFPLHLLYIVALVF